MYRIRFHGRGGQGMKTASRILGTSLFLAGYEVQDAPRYGAERRGAPIFAYVRAARAPIFERGIIDRPDLVVIADDSLVSVSAAGVMQGVGDRTVILLNSSENGDTWQHRLNIKGPVVILPAKEKAPDRSELHYIGAACAGAAAGLLGIVQQDQLLKSIEQELAPLDTGVVQKNYANALAAYNFVKTETAVRVHEGEPVSARGYARPGWLDLPFEDARISAPVIHAGLTSVEVKTGLWRTLRPIIDYSRCRGCWWVCSTFCPDSAISVIDRRPEIDYDHCKGCLVCLAQCSADAIAAVPESPALEKEQATEEGRS